MSREIDILLALIKDLSGRVKDLEQAAFPSEHKSSLTLTTKIMSDTYAYIWVRDAQPGTDIEVDIRYLYTPAVPPITIGPPDAWVEGESATLTIMVV